MQIEKWVPYPIPQKNIDKPITTHMLKLRPTMTLAKAEEA
jgi:hypothetical protein